MSLVAALTLMAGAAHAEKPREQSKSKKVMVQELTLDQFQQKVYNLSDANASSSLTYLGDKPAIVDFYASWCGPCISGMNRIKQLYETYRAAGLEVIGVSLDSRREAWLRAIEKEGLPWSNISNLDGWQTGFDSYGIQSLPAFVLIRCSDGQIVARKPWGRASHIPVGEIEKLLGQ